MACARELYEAVLTEGGAGDGNHHVMDQHLVTAKLKSASLVPPILKSKVSLVTKRWNNDGGKSIPLSCLHLHHCYQAEIEDFRLRMAVDLENLIAAVENGSSSSIISDPLHQVGVTSFHLAHQGLNDKHLQVCSGVD